MKKYIAISLIALLLIPLGAKAEQLDTLHLSGDIETLATKGETRTVEFLYEGDERIAGYAKIKIQGNSSVGYPKKNYNITLYKDKELESKYKVDFGWGKESKYTLKANYIDTKTNARNIGTAKIYGTVQKKYNLFEDTPNNGEIDGYPILVYVNNEFWGIYTWNTPKEDWVYGLDEKNENHLLLMGEKWTDSVLFKEEAILDGSWEFEIGEENEENLEKLNRLIRFVKDSSDKDFKKHFDEYFNLDSVLNYYIMCQYAQLSDNTGKNMMVITTDGYLWSLTLYDLDTSWGTWYDLSGSLKNIYGENAYKELVDLNRNLLFKRVGKLFKKDLTNRYFELRNSILNHEAVMEVFESIVADITPEYKQMEIEKWGELHGEDVEQIKEFLSEREPIIDSYFKDLYNPGATVLKVSEVFAIIVEILIAGIAYKQNKKRIKNS